MPTGADQLEGFWFVQVPVAVLSVATLWLLHRGAFRRIGLRFQPRHVGPAHFTQQKGPGLTVRGQPATIIEQSGQHRHRVGRIDRLIRGRGREISSGLKGQRHHKPVEIAKISVDQRLAEAGFGRNPIDPEGVVSLIG